MDSYRYALDRAHVVVFDPEDSICEIAREHPSLRFTTVSGKILFLPQIPTTASPSDFEPDVPAFLLDAQKGERIRSVHLTYASYYDAAFPTTDVNRFYGATAEPELVDMSFTTSLGRSTEWGRREPYPGVVQVDPTCEFELRAPEGEEIAGLYVYGYEESTMFHGLLTRRTGGTKMEGEGLG